MQLFFTPTIEPHHTFFLLDEEESKHAIRVLRLGTGDTLYLVDGRGGLYKTELIDPHPKRVGLRVLDVQIDFGRSRYHLHIAVAPTKNIDRIEWFLEKATEIGLQELTPIICEHSERKEVKIGRLEKIAVSAMKQSLKAYLPQINSAVTFSNFLSSIANDGAYSKGIAHCVEAEKQYISSSFPPTGKYMILIGPEGDFSDKEIAQALSAGCVPLSLGEARLRTETAALASCLEVALLNR